MSKVDSTIQFYLNKYFGALANKIALGDILNDMTPSHVLKYCGEFPTEGGDAAETIAVTGILATDIVHVTLHTKGASPETILEASASADQIDVVMSGDPSTDHVLSYSVLRALT